MLRMNLPRTARFFVFFVLFALAGPARAEFSQYDTATYDINALGVPKFLNTNYIDMRKITKITKFRSAVGHDYSDATQFGPNEDMKGFGPVESCRSMKHYFVQPDATTDIYAPTGGIVSRIFEEGLGTQVHITSDAQPAFTIIIFHVRGDAPFAVGQKITEGQHLGKHFTENTYSDIAVAVHTPTGYHLISYFEILTDAAFAVFKAKGIASPSDVIIPRAERDAAPLCVAGFNSPPSDFVAVTPGAATQTVTLKTPLKSTYHLGDAPYKIETTSSSGLPVTVLSSTFKTCALGPDGTVTWRRPGYCAFTLSSPTDANTFAYGPVEYGATVLAAGAPEPAPPRLGGVYPTSASGPQSYIRFVNTGAAGTVTLTLTNAGTGQSLLTWTSPSIPAFAAPQYPISTLESAAPAGFVRPAMYGIRVEPATTVTGYLQHVLYHPADGTLTNASTCDSGVTTAGRFIGNVHSSYLGGLGYPSSIVLHNVSGIGGLYEFLEAYNAGTGASLGDYFHGPIQMNGGAFISAAQLESGARFTAGTLLHYVVNLSSYYFGFPQHLVTNQRSGAIVDMTAVCALDGKSKSYAAITLYAGALYSGSQGSSLSFLRFYNAGAFAGTVSVSLYDPGTGQNLGTWTSPSIAPDAEQQVDIGTIETAIGLVKRPNYEFSIDSVFDGYFQHVLYRPGDGTVTNLSTCKGAVSADPRTLIGVHSSLLGAGGFPSTIVVNNTDIAAAKITLGIYDARDGAKLGTYVTDTIAAGGQARVDVGAMEAAARITPTAQYHYVIKAELTGAGFLQHLVNNQKVGIITDMTTVCLM